MWQASSYFWRSSFPMCIIQLGASQVVLEVKKPLANAGNTGEVGLIPGPGTFLGGGHGNRLQYSCLENPMDRGAWQATDYSITKSWTQLKWLSMHSSYSFMHIGINFHNKFPQNIFINILFHIVLRKHSSKCNQQMFSVLKYLFWITKHKRWYKHL